MRDKKSLIMGSKKKKKKREKVTVPGLWTVPVYIEEEDREHTPQRSKLNIPLSKSEFFEMKYI